MYFHPSNRGGMLKGATRAIEDNKNQPVETFQRLFISVRYPQQSLRLGRHLVAVRAVALIKVLSNEIFFTKEVIEEDISKVEALVDVLVYVLIGVDVGVLVLAELGVGAESGTEEVVTAASKVTLLETRLFGTLVVLVVLVALVLMFGLGLDG